MQKGLRVIKKQAHLNVEDEGVCCRTDVACEINPIVAIIAEKTNNCFIFVKEVT